MANMGNLEKVLSCLNNIREAGLILNYAIGGGYAVMYYDVPFLTYDLDVFVLLSSEEDYHKLYEHFRSQGAKIENVYIFIEGMAVQFLPSYISPLFKGAIEDAKTIKIRNLRSRFVSLEYLILLLLTAFRPKDKIRIQSLLAKADRDLLLSLLARFDDEQKTLHERYKKILAGT